MNAIRMISTVILVIALFLGPTLATADMTITSPQNGAVLTTKLVRVEGTASSVSSYINETSQADFTGGTPTNLAITATGEIVLEITLSIGAPVRQNNGDAVLTGDGSGFDGVQTAGGPVLYEDGGFKMFYYGRDASGYTLPGYATSADGITWARQATPVLNLGLSWDNQYIMIKGAYNNSGTILAPYTGHTPGKDRVGCAASNDGGHTFSKLNGGSPVIPLGASGKFDSLINTAGGMIKEGITYRMVYGGGDGSVVRIGIATTEDCVSWIKANNGDAVLDVSAPGGWDSWYVGGGRGDLVVIDGTYILFYDASPTTDHSANKIGFATSADGVKFTKGNGGQAWFGKGTGGKFDEVSVLDPHVYVEGNTIHMWYIGFGTGGWNGMGYAKATYSHAPGTYVSKALDAGGTVAWGTADYTSYVPTGGSLGVKTRTSADNLVWSSWADVVDGGQISSPDNRYLQYQVVLNKTGSENPSLNDINITYSIDVKQVDVSLDGTTWFKAGGTPSAWYMDLALSEGVNTIRVRATDSRGGTTIKTISVTVDSIPPIGSIVLNDGLSFTNLRKVSVALSAGDQSGIDSMMLSESSAFTGASWVKYAQQAWWNFTDVDGNHTLYVKYKDNSGLESVAYSDWVIIDRKPPAGNISINGGARYTNTASVLVDINVTDENGITGVLLSHTQTGTGNYSPPAKSMAWALSPGDGTKIVWAKVKDPTGNSVDFTDDIILDTTLPVLTVELADGAAVTGKPNVTLSIDATDINGITGMMVSSDPSFTNKAWVPYANLVAYDIGSGDGVKTVYVKVKDAAGNTATATDSIILNMKPPEGTLKINDGAIYTTSTNVTLTLTVQNQSEIGQMMVSNDPGFAGASWVAFKASTPWVLTQGDGLKTVYVKLRNIYGIENPNISGKITLDTKMPQVTIVSPTKGSTTDKTLKLSGTASDESGLAKVEVKVDSGNWVPAQGLENWTYQIQGLKNGKHSIIIKAVDKAGNEQLLAKEITKKDAKSVLPGFEPMIVIAVLACACVIVQRMRRTSDK
jgi:hypothetical protein